MKILLADTDDARARALTQQLAQSPCHEVRRLQPGQPLLDAVASFGPDIVIVDMARPDRDALDEVREITERNPRPIAMFVDEADSAFMAEAIEAGVSSYTVVGAVLPDVRPIVLSAIMIFQRFNRVASDLREAERRIEERRTVDKAKTLLMRRDGSTEAQAYQWLRKRAMNSGKRIADVAADWLARHTKSDKAEGQEDET